jgi:hypothetical protein
LGDKTRICYNQYDHAQYENADTFEAFPVTDPCEKKIYSNHCIYKRYRYKKSVHIKVHQIFLQEWFVINNTAKTTNNNITVNKIGIKDEFVLISHGILHFPLYWLMILP